MLAGTPPSRLTVVMQGLFPAGCMTKKGGEWLHHRGTLAREATISRHV